MEYRKIIEFGKSSYVVSLPKSWLAEKKLGKGDTVYLNLQDDKISIYPTEQKKTAEPKRIKIDVTGMTDKEIRLHLISKYVRNFNEITLVADDMSRKAKDIRNIIHDIMALEVVEETASRIVTRDFLDMDDICPLSLLKKMDVITREMLSDSKNSFKEDKYENIAERDNDVNRLSYLFFRVMKYLQHNPAAASKRGYNNEMLLMVWAAAVKMESVADQSKRLAKLMPRVKFNKDEQKQFVKLYATIERYYLDTINAFYSNDSSKAFQLLVQKRNMIKLCKDFYRQNWNHEWVPVMLEKMTAIIADCKSLLTYICDMEPE